MREQVRLGVEQLESRKLLAGMPLGMLVEWNDPSGFSARGGMTGRGGSEVLESREAPPQIFILLASGRNQDGPRAGGGELIILPPSSAASMFLWAMARELRFDSSPTSGGSASGGSNPGGIGTGGVGAGGVGSGGGIDRHDPPSARPLDPDQGEGEAPEDLPGTRPGRGPNDTPISNLPGNSSGTAGSGTPSGSLGGTSGTGTGGASAGTGSGTTGGGIGSTVGADRGGGSSILGPQSGPAFRSEELLTATSFFAADVDSIWSGLGGSSVESPTLMADRNASSSSDASGFARSSVVARELRQVASGRVTAEAEDEGEVSEAKRDGQELRGADASRGKPVNRRWAARGIGATQRPLSRDSFVMDTLVDDAIESLLLRLRDVTPTTDDAFADASTPDASGEGGYVELDTDAPVDEAAADRAVPREVREAAKQDAG